MQAGKPNKAVELKVPAGLARLFKSHLDWNLYTSTQPALDGREVCTCTVTPCWLLSSALLHIR